MKKYHSKTFGEINLDKPEDFYEAEVDWQGHSIYVSLDISESGSVESDLLKAVDELIDNLEGFESQVRQVLKEDFAQKGLSKEFIDFHLKELDKEEIEELIQDTPDAPSLEERLFSALQLHHINFYPEEEEDTFVLFDYALFFHSDQILGVYVMKDMESCDIAWES